MLKKHDAIIVTVVLVVVALAALFFIGPKTTGKAFFTGGEGTAGFADANPFIRVGNTETYSVQANIGGRQTVAYEFMLTFNQNVARCQTVAQGVVAGSLDLFEGVYLCDNNAGTVRVRRAVVMTDGSLQTGLLTLGPVILQGVLQGDPQVRFDYIRVYDAQTGGEIALQIRQPEEVVVRNLCTTGNLQDCRTEAECEGVPGTWDSATAVCLPRQECNANNLDACVSQPVCEAANLFWYENRCNAEVQGCAVDNLGPCTRQQCQDFNRFFYNDRCNLLQEAVTFRAGVRANDTWGFRGTVYMYLIGNRSDQVNVILGSSVDGVNLAPGQEYVASVTTREAINVKRKEIFVVDRPLSSNHSVVGALNVSYNVVSGVFQIDGNPQPRQGTNVTVRHILR
jgi:hypothetical protein